MPRWLFRVLGQVRGLADQGGIAFTFKAFAEPSDFNPPLEMYEACEVLAHLTPAEFIRRVWSHQTGEWLYVFKPQIWGMPTYVKLALRDECVVISFHKDTADVE